MEYWLVGVMVGDCGVCRCWKRCRSTQKGCEGCLISEWVRTETSVPHGNDNSIRKYDLRKGWVFEQMEFVEMPFGWVCGRLSLFLNTDISYFLLFTLYFLLFLCELRADMNLWVQIFGDDEWCVAFLFSKAVCFISNSISDSYSDFSVETKFSCFEMLAVKICELGCEFAICVSFS